MRLATPKTAALMGAAVIAGILAAPQPAMAAPAPTQVRVGLAATSAGTPAVSVADCLKGEEAVGGGYDTEAATEDTVVRQSRPRTETGGTVGTPIGWRSVVTDGTIRSYVVCVPAAWRDPVIKKASTSGSERGLVAQRYCPPGQRATGGGFRIGGATAASIVHASRPLGVRGWEGIATSVSSVNAYVICVTEGTTTFFPQSAEVPWGGLAATVAECPAGSTATGGGFEIGGFRSRAIVNTSRPFPPVADATAKGWQVYFTDTGGRVMVVCTQ